MVRQRVLNVVLMKDAGGGGMEPQPPTRQVAYSGKRRVVRF
jgi:hypothetical protein